MTKDPGSFFLTLGNFCAVNKIHFKNFYGIFSTLDHLESSEIAYKFRLKRKKGAGIF